MQLGLYEGLVTKLISSQLDDLDKHQFQVKTTSIDKAEAAKIISQHMAKSLHYAFSSLKESDKY